jgi:quercetin dioxygenase-like cupin family protein
MEKPGKEELKERALTLRDLVAYQKGSVVSRMLVYKKAGTITLFAFDAGEGLSEHTAPYDAIVTILDGEAEIAIAGTPFHLKEGGMIIMPANKPHALHAAQRFKMMLTMIHE